MLVQDERTCAVIQAAEQGLADGDLVSAADKLSIAFESAGFAFQAGQMYDYRKSISSWLVKTPSAR
jgi:hypothetical protein